MDDRVAGEETAPFVVRGAGGDVGVDLDATWLHLSERLTDAWTARWAGLRPELQATLSRELPSHEPAALYHCEQALLPPGAAVTLIERPALLTDLAPKEAAEWAMRRAMSRLAPALALLLVGIFELP